MPEKGFKLGSSHLFPHPSQIKLSSCHLTQHSLSCC